MAKLGEYHYAFKGKASGSVNSEALYVLHLTFLNTAFYRHVRPLEFPTYSRQDGMVIIMVVFLLNGSLAFVL